ADKMGKIENQAATCCKPERVGAVKKDRVYILQRIRRYRQVANLRRFPEIEKRVSNRVNDPYRAIWPCADFSPGADLDRRPLKCSTPKKKKMNGLSPSYP